MRKLVHASLAADVDLFGVLTNQIDGVSEEDELGLLPPPGSRSIEVLRSGMIEVKDYGEHANERTVERAAYIWPAPGSVVTYTKGREGQE